MPIGGSFAKCWLDSAQGPMRRARRRAQLGGRRAKGARQLKHADLRKQVLGDRPTAVDLSQARVVAFSGQQPGLGR
jgi:hypothetical protein